MHHSKKKGLNNCYILDIYPHTCRLAEEKKTAA